MKKLSYLFVLLILFNLNLFCQLSTSINYQYKNLDNGLTFSISNYINKSDRNLAVADEFSIFKLGSGVRKVDQVLPMNYIYDFEFISYYSFLRIPLIKSNNVDTNILYYEGRPILSDSHNTFLTFSYKGLELSNLGIYHKYFNWSSVGVDLLYKDFEIEKTSLKFYSRFSYILSASTIENSKNYFEEIDSSFESQFCFNTKIMNTTKLRMGYSGEIKLETYYAMFYNDLKQNEFCSSLKYSYFTNRDIDIYAQLGYMLYGANGKWKNLGTFNLGLSYSWGFGW